MGGEGWGDGYLAAEHLDGAVRNDLVHLVRVRSRGARGREEVGFEGTAPLTFMLDCVQP